MRNKHIPQTKRGYRRTVVEKPRPVAIRQLSGEMRREMGLVPGLVRTVETIEHEEAMEQAMAENLDWIRNNLLS